jgi:hypothetical protein
MCIYIYTHAYIYIYIYIEGNAGKTSGIVRKDGQYELQPWDIAYLINVAQSNQNNGKTGTFSIVDIFNPTLPPVRINMPRSGFFTRPPKEI